MSVALTLTIAHSLALILMRLWLRSSAYSAPIRDPMEVPPMRSTGMPASQRALRIPTWEQPLSRRVEKVHVVEKRENLMFFTKKPEMYQRAITLRRKNDRLTFITPIRPLLPCAASSENEGDGIAREDASQAGEVRVAVCWLLKHTLIQLQLEKKEITVIKVIKWTTKQIWRCWIRCQEAQRGAARRGERSETPFFIPTNLGRLLLEKTLRGQERWRCLEIQLRMFSQSTVPLGWGPSSLCNSTSCFWARTALPSNMRSS